MQLDKNQLDFLKKLAELDTMQRKDIDDSQLDIILYLNKQGLIYVDRSLSGMRINPITHKYENDGEILSVSISEQGKAYLSETAHKDEFMESIEKIAKSAEIQSDIALKTSKKADVKGWIAVIISIFALLIEFMAYHKEIFSFLSKFFS